MAKGEIDPLKFVTTFQSTFATAIDRLVAAGASRIVLCTLPPLEDFPAVQRFSRPVREMLNIGFESLNSAIYRLGLWRNIRRLDV